MSCKVAMVRDTQRVMLQISMTTQINAPLMELAFNAGPINTSAIRQSVIEAIILKLHAFANFHQ
jgi:hypothetical protein